MGLIKAIKDAVGGTLADQWVDFFSCNSMEADVLMQKGRRATGGRGSNTKGSDNVITTGSGVVVADGQCVVITDGGRIAEVCAEPGGYTYDASSERTIFRGNLSESIHASIEQVSERFAYGGSAAKDQRVYYFNTKEIVGNKYGTPNPIPFRVVDGNIGLDIDTSVRCNGEYSFRIVDPVLFYTNLAGTVQDEFRREEIDSQLKAELMTALQPALAKVSGLGVRYSTLPAHAQELADALNGLLSTKWKGTRGIVIESFAINPVTIPKEDEDLIKELQRTATMRDPSMAAATLVSAQSDAMRTAAGNEAGAMMGFLGLNMAQQAGGGTNAQQLFDMAAQQQAAQQAAQQQQSAQQGAIPANALFRCNKCGWVPEDPKIPPKFCPECGDRFDAGDMV
ncbi:MAG: SPFH domain-containing protein [Clostridiales Family XIII bacterium]|jgi:membrane protease subunit (stomatin/prohibitin family)|nr:SPFH domain-containing protein [Clostridiales Family XIII bacterium]